jgi:Tfp pilus assembly protein PilN
VLQVVAQEEQNVIQAYQQQLNLVNAIQAQNLPWTNVLLYLGRAVPPGVGLTKVTADPAGNALNISAEARSIGLIPILWQNLQLSGFFLDAVPVDVTQDANNKVNAEIRALLPPPGPVQTR